MIIGGHSRGNGAQLGAYLLDNDENEQVLMLDIRGTAKPHDLKKSLLEMSLTSELSKGVHGLYHGYMAPTDNDKITTREEWLKAADILEKHLGFVGQKRVIVLQQKNDKVHAHIVWERFDHQTRKLKSDSENYDKHMNAAAEIEQALGLEKAHRPERATAEKTEGKRTRKKPDSQLKQSIAELWKQSKDGRSFIAAAEKAGFKIAVGDHSRPWRIITHEGKSENLLRHLEKGIKTKDVRQRLEPIRAELKTEAQALKEYRTEKNAGEKETKPALQNKETVIQAAENFKDIKPSPATNDNKPFIDRLALFKDNDESRIPLKERAKENSIDLGERQRSMLNDWQQNKGLFGQNDMI